LPEVTAVLGGPMRALADAALATVQAALEPAAFAEAFASGREMALAKAVVPVLVSHNHKH
jgi:head-tail adaptor